MKEIKLTQGKVTIVDDDDYEYLRQFKWYCHRGYARRMVRANGKQKSVFMHRIINNTPEGMFTDHINGDRLDNRKENLRSCTTQQNNANRKIQDNNTMGYKGVVIQRNKYKDKIYLYIKSEISYNGRVMNLGRFKTVDEAARVYNQAAVKYYGEFARLNEVA